MPAPAVLNRVLRPSLRLTVSGTAATVERRPVWAKRQEDVAVSVRFRYLLAATVGLCVALPLPAQEPGPFAVERGRSLPPRQTANEQLATTIAEQLQQSGHLHHYTVDLSVRDGAVELTGTVIDQPQREEVLRIVQGVPGVARVVDRLTLVGSITQVQAADPPAVLQTPQGPDLGAVAPCRTLRCRLPPAAAMAAGLVLLLPGRRSRCPCTRRRCRRPTT
jgi:hypothetical protein